MKIVLFTNIMLNEKMNELGGWVAKIVKTCEKGESLGSNMPKEH